MAFREAFHLGFAGLFYFAIYYDLFQIRFPDAIKVRHESSGGRLKYLTFWNLALQAVFFSLSFVNDFVGTRTEDVTKRGRLQTLLDTVFTSLGFPTSVFVSTSFWTIYIFNRELVFPLIFDSFFPVWLNHILHSSIFPAVMLEMYFVYHHYTCRKRSLALLSFFVALYLAWTFVIAYNWQFWTYPILEVLNWWQRSVFFVTCVAFVSIYYFIGEALHGLVWRKSMKQKSQKKNKNKKKKKTT